MNSFRYIRAALEYEIERQIEIVEGGGRVIQETRLWNDERGPHLLDAIEGAGARLPLLPGAGPAAANLSPRAWKTRSPRLPELPEARRARMIAEYEITAQDAQTLTATREFADRSKPPRRRAKNPRRVANLVQSELDHASQRRRP